MKYIKNFRLFESSEEDGIFDVAKNGFGLITPNGKIIGCSMYDHMNYYYTKDVVVSGT